MKSPPMGVKLVLEVVCVLKGIKPDKVKDLQTLKQVDDYWKPSVKMIGDMKFLESLVTFEKVRLSHFRVNIQRKL